MGVFFSRSECAHNFLLRMTATQAPTLPTSAVFLQQTTWSAFQYKGRISS